MVSAHRDGDLDPRAMVWMRASATLKDRPDHARVRSPLPHRDDAARLSSVLVAERFPWAENTVTGASLDHATFHAPFRADEWLLYERLYTELLQAPAARPPRLLIYLDAPVDVMLDRIATRGRPKERDTPSDYWISLHGRYERWIAGFRHCPVFRLDVREYDLIADPTGIDVVAKQVRRRLEPELPQAELF